ncbi:MAG: twin-arginine translocation signal domain-containing protein [Symbiopectobacterium sp.]|uniref:twin-arginine translocation signal domain-containing protein n=1 Tax=Symbiopectobacterium sp. TaxID=2952789 RepID=UPI003F3376F9
MMDKNWRFSCGTSAGKQTNSEDAMVRERRDFIKAGLVATAAVVLPCFATGAIDAT